MQPTNMSITPQTATYINKALAILAIAAFAAAATAVFPSFGPSTSANAASMPVKSNKLSVATASELQCAEQNWPNFNASCLRGGKAAAPVRFVTTDKL